MHLLVAVDGTRSATDYNVGTNRSYTRKFYDRFGGRGAFFEGPASIIGTDVDNIERAAWSYLTRELRALGDNDRIRVSLVGHSRGGHIVTALARRLAGIRVGELTASPRLTVQSPLFRAHGDLGPSPLEPSPANPPPFYKVHFLGLYDAVDMTWNSGDTSVIPGNVTWYAHAVRSVALGSRSSWGNTGRPRGLSSQHSIRSFTATHGSIGGAPAEHCLAEIRFNGGDWCHFALRASENRAGGLEAHQYILAEARRAGLPI